MRDRSGRHTCSARAGSGIMISTATSRTNTGGGTTMLQQILRLTAACAVLLLAGCAALRSPIAPSGPTPEQQQWIAGSADLAALGCGILMIERPGDVQTARDGLAAAAQVLRSDYPQVIDLATALDHALPRQYAWVTAISEEGYVAPMPAPADGKIIDGSARLERVAERLRDVDPLVIEHDGTRPIIAIRTDIPHANTPQAKRIALRANRIAQVDLDWDVDLLASLNAEVPDLTKGLWSDEELAALFDAQPAHDVDALEDIPGPTTPYVLAGDEWQLGSH